MDRPLDNEQHDLMLETVVEVVASYVSNNSVPAADLPGLIENVHASFNVLSGKAAAAKADAPREPAVPVKKSVTNQHVTCLGCGKRFSSLKRHIATSHGQTPEEYRESWGLKRDYPMTAPAYSKQRSALALAKGLGRKAAPAPAAPAPKRGRRKAA